MKKIFKRFLCMVTFAVLTVLCARAESSILVVESLTPNALPLIEGKDNIELSRDESELQTVKARVILFNKKRRYAVLSVDDSSQLTKKIDRASYWLRSDKLLERVYVCGRKGRYLTRSADLPNGMLSCMVRIAPDLRAANNGDDRVALQSDSDLDNQSGEGSSVDMDEQYDAPDFATVSPDYSPVFLERRRNFKLTVIAPDGSPIVFEGTTFCDEATLRSLVGGTVTEIEELG